MKRKWNNVLSWLLTMVMLVTSFEGFSIPVLADDDPSEIVSVDEISYEGLTAEGENDGSAADKALSVSVNEGETLTISFNSAVLSGNDADHLTASADAVVTWKLVSVNEAEEEVEPDDALTALNFIAAEDSEDGNKFVVSSNATISGNATFKLTASYNGAEP
ncbi:MAG: hypothetical protein J6X66_13190, partial [Lachnospiraceae bacterium]|nr:hypothetical protein [Lachnospiraceae bacterium]